MSRRTGRSTDGAEAHLRPALAFPQESGRGARIAPGKPVCAYAMQRLPCTTDASRHVLVRPSTDPQGPLAEPWPLEEDALPELFEVARDPGLWRLTSVDYSDPALFYPSFETALHERRLGKTYPFVVRLAGSGRIVGTTRLLDIQPNARKLEIGVTWLARECWGQGINAGCKQLLLAYCFEKLAANRVQFRAKADNGRSRRALEKIGAVFEGVLRQDTIEPNGSPGTRPSTASCARNGLR
ncbi:GNAT family N-acetyltransferase [Fulvimonas yonginensis]|uniref:GNAT family N-acetyltransferase n=1 Tax=Fulvimonas yonginensis TaxID=1495200 RepID=A0ABU8JFB7_9GAMM